MQQLPSITVSNQKFEDLLIDSTSLLIVPFVEDLQSNSVTAITKLWKDVRVNYTSNGCHVVGDLCIRFRNQGDSTQSCLLLIGDVSASSISDPDPASVFSKLIQFIFEMLNKYISENRVKDANGHLFKLPGFDHSKYRFTDFR